MAEQRKNHEDGGGKIMYEKIIQSQSKVWKFQESKNKELEGIFTGKREHLGPNNSTLYEFEFIGPEGEFTVGEKVGVWQTALLADRLNTLVPGEKVKMEYLGKQKGKKGTSFHNFEVYHDVPES